MIGPVKSMGNPVNLSATPINYRLAPPTLGQHTREVLVELGYDETAIASFREKSVV